MSNSPNTNYNKELKALREKALENCIVLNNVQMFSKYKCLAQESIYNNLEEASIQSNLAGNEDKDYSFSTISKNIISLSFPTIFFYFITYLQETICLSYLGNLGEQEILNGYGIISLFLTCTLTCVVTGVVSGLDTLLPNAWSMKNLRLFNIYIQRARVLCLILGIPIAILDYFIAVRFLRVFNASEESLSYGQIYILPALVMILIQVQFNINFTILAVINKIKEILICLLFSLIMHFFWCFLFIKHYQIGILGAGLSLILSQILNLLSSSFLIYKFNNKNEIKRRQESNDEILDINSNSDCERIEVLIRFDAEVFTGLKQYLYFVLPNTLLLAAEWMAFEIQGLIALSLNKDDYSIHLLLTNFAHLTNTFSSGFGMATAILIAEKVGKLIVKESRFIAVYSFIIAQGFMSIIVILILIFRKTIFNIFISEEGDQDSLLSLGVNCIHFLAIFSVLDATQAVMAGVFRGYGKQKIASLIALVQYYILQTFMSWFLGKYMEQGVKGIWTSINIGAGTTTLVYFIVFLLLDYNKILEETRERIEADTHLIKQYSNVTSIELSRTNNYNEAKNNSKLEESLDN